MLPKTRRQRNASLLTPISQLAPNLLSALFALACVDASKKCSHVHSLRTEKSDVNSELTEVCCYSLQLMSFCSFADYSLSNATTLRHTVARSTCVANLNLSILAAAALHAQERGEAEDEEQKRTNRHGCGEVPIGACFLSLERIWLRFA